MVVYGMDKFYVKKGLTFRDFEKAGGVNHQFYHDYVRHLSGSVVETESVTVSGNTIRIYFINTNGERDWWSVGHEHQELMLVKYVEPPKLDEDLFEL